jgi:hypothetical protein
MTKIQKPQNILELGEVDISALKKTVLQTSEKVWDFENKDKENNFECFHHTRHIIFRFIKGMRDHRLFYSNPVWDFWQEKLLPVMNSAIVPYNFHKPVFPKVMLARLAAGSVIDPHRDGAGSNLHTHKIHIPIQTNEKAVFWVNEESFFLKEGVAYEVNNIVLHGVENFGNEDRIHLIFEVFEGAQA